ncbi:MAG: IclR family transcriptional regulator [Homoserinimonas sp.]
MIGTYEQSLHLANVDRKRVHKAIEQAAERQSFLLGNPSAKLSPIERPPMESHQRRTSSTVTHALRLLVLLSNAPEGLGVAESARLLGIGRSSAHLLLSTLEQEKFVTGSKSGVYRLGLAAFEVGAALPMSLKFDESRLHGMRSLANRSGEAVSISVQANTDAIIIKRIESAELLRAEIKLGTRMPLHASASGKVLLATMPEMAILSLYPDEELPRARQATLKTRSELVEHIRSVREAGFAINANELTHGVVAIACAIPDENGNIIGALSIAGPANRFDPQAWADDLQLAALSMFPGQPIEA